MKDSDSVERLMQRLKAIDQKIVSTRKDKTIRIGFHGIQSAGKSSYLAALRLFPSTRDWRRFKIPRTSDFGLYDLTLTIKGKTAIYLEQLSSALLKQGSTNATPAVVPKGLSFIATHRFTEDRGSVTASRYVIQTMDFAGTFVRPQSDKAMALLADETRQFFEKCDVMFCLIDSSAIDIAQVEAIAESLPDTTLAVAVLLTKSLSGNVTLFFSGLPRHCGN